MTARSLKTHSESPSGQLHPGRRLSFFMAVALVSCGLLPGCARDAPLPGDTPLRIDPPTDGEAPITEPGATPPAASETQTGTPVFEPDPGWPIPLTDDHMGWPDLSRNAMSVAVDPRDHVWILQSPTPEDRAAETTDGVNVPRVFEFDATGTFLHGWGGPGTSSSWMQQPEDGLPYPAGTPAEHGMFVDHENNVWITGNGHVALKFNAHGELLMQIGEPGRTNGSNDQALLGNSCELTVDPATNEVYIADGYINRRVVVFDSRSGEYKRHWGAYGNRPVDFQLLDNGLYADSTELHVPDGAPQQQFLAVHCVRIANDGLVYVCDRQRNRVQIFQRDGTFMTELSVAADTPTELGFPEGVGAVNFGSASTIGFSADATQQFLYVGDNMNAKIWIFRRRDLELLGSVDTKPQANHYLSVDSAGNLYNSGLQKFVLTGFH